MLEMVTEEYGAYVEGTVAGFIKKFPLDIEKLGYLIAAEDSLCSIGEVVL